VQQQAVERLPARMALDAAERPGLGIAAEVADRRPGQPLDHRHQREARGDQ
jgi:hypothetical protein